MYVKNHIFIPPIHLLPTTYIHPHPHTHTQPQFDPKVLSKSKLKIEEGASSGAVLEVIEASQEGEGEEEGGETQRQGENNYEIVLGEPTEAAAYQVLLHAEGQAPGVLKIPKPTTRQVVVVQRPPRTPAKGAAGEEEGSTTGAGGGASGALGKAKQMMVVPYSHIEQVQGMEVRFKPSGAGSRLPTPEEKEEEETDKGKGNKRGRGSQAEKGGKGKAKRKR